MLKNINQDKILNFQLAALTITGYKGQAYYSSYRDNNYHLECLKVAEAQSEVCRHYSVHPEGKINLT